MNIEKETKKTTFRASEVSLSSDFNTLMRQAVGLRSLCSGLEQRLSDANARVEELEKELSKVDHEEINALRETNARLTSLLETAEERLDLLGGDE